MKPANMFTIETTTSDERKRKQNYYVALCSIANNYHDDETTFEIRNNQLFNVGDTAPVLIGDVANVIEHEAIDGVSFRTTSNSWNVQYFAGFFGRVLIDTLRREHGDEYVEECYDDDRCIFCLRDVFMTIDELTFVFDNGAVVTIHESEVNKLNNETKAK